MVLSVPHKSVCVHRVLEEHYVNKVWAKVAVIMLNTDKYFIELQN